MNTEQSLPAESPSHRSGGLLFFSLIALTILGCYLFMDYYYTLREQHSFPPEEVIGGKVPQPPFREAQGIETQNGRFVQLFAPDNNVKLSLMVSSSPDVEPELEVFQAVRGFKLAKKVAPGYSRSSLAFLSGQFDSRRAKNYEPLTLNVGGRQVEAARVTAKRDEEFLFGIAKVAEDEHAFSLMTLEKRVSIGLAEKLLGALPLFSLE